MSKTCAISVAVTQHNPYQDEYEYGSETASTKFFGAITCDESSEEIVHKGSFSRKRYNQMPESGNHKDLFLSQVISFWTYKGAKPDMR